MVVDTSALVAILLGEPERDAFVAALAAVPDPLISAVTLVETSIVMEAKTGRPGVTDLDGLLRAAGVRTVAVDEDQAFIARDAYRRYRRGRRGLTLGDCFSYALAKAKARPLLFKGDDFTGTDVDVVGA